MDPIQRRALAQLEHLLETRPGWLKVITGNLAALERPGGAPRTPEEEQAVMQWPFDNKHPLHQVAHDVVRIVPHGDKGRFRAYSREGDICEGYPQALLRRLQEWSRAFEDLPDLILDLEAKAADAERGQGPEPPMAVAASLLGDMRAELETRNGPALRARAARMRTWLEQHEG